MARLRRTSPSPSVRSSVFDGYSTETPSRSHRAVTQALSPSPSASSDKENQATPDAENNRSNKGKGLMAPPSRPSMEQRGNKRRRLGEQTSRSASTGSETLAGEMDNARDDAESHYTNGDQKYFNPEQDEDERRYVRHSMRENIRNFNDHRDQLMNDNGEGLIKYVKKQNELMRKVRQTADATIDSRFLVAGADVAVKRAKADGDTSAGVDIDDFITKSIAFMRNGGRVASNDGAGDDPDTARPSRNNNTTTQHPDSDDEGEGPEGDALPWHIFGAHACFPSNRRPPVPTFLLGPLSVQKRARQTQPRTQRRTQATAAASQQQESRPQELRPEDLQSAENTNLTLLVQRIWARLKRVQDDGVGAIERALDADEDEELSDEKLNELCRKVHVRKSREDGEPGVPLFEFVVNPWSFGQSVENAFYVSFLVKEGKVAVVGDEDGLPILRYIEKPRTVEEQRALNVSRRQAIVSLDYQSWEGLIAAFDIAEPLIPHREQEEQQVGSTGWYG